jgi:hypothetical protein
VLRLALAYSFDLLLPIGVLVGAAGLFAATTREALMPQLQKQFRSFESLELAYQIINAVPALLLCAFLIVRPIRFALAVGAVLLAQATLANIDQRESPLVITRTPFGILRVDRAQDFPPPEEQLAFQPESYLRLMHGTTNHGTNYVQPMDRSLWGDPNRDFSRLATTYYHRHGPAGVVMEKFCWFHEPLNAYSSDVRLPASLVGLGVTPLAALTPLPTGQLVALWSEPPYAGIGLGVGTLASYGRPFQQIDFYELDPQVAALSESSDTVPAYFHFLNDARQRGAEVKVRLGDGRLTLQREGPEGYYHALFVDAFNSDAVPVHLLTREAFTLYFSKLAPHGVVCFHVSNRYLDLAPVIAATAESLKYSCRSGNDMLTSRSRGHFSSQWVVVARSVGDLEQLQPPAGFEERLREEAARGQRFDRIARPEGGQFWQVSPSGRTAAWTDNYSNLAGALRNGRAGKMVVMVETLLGGLGLVLLLWLGAEIVLRVLWPARKQPGKAELPEAFPVPVATPPAGFTPG